METEALQPPTSGSSAATTNPRWVLLLESSSKEEPVGSYAAADGARTLATARTSTGHLIGVSLRLAAPPAVSSVCVHFPHGVAPNKAGGKVVATHGDSILINIWFEQGHMPTRRTDDYFVYNAGAAAAEPRPRLPSLSLIPPNYFTEQERKKMHMYGPPVQRHLHTQCTGLQRRGEDEFVVAELKLVAAASGGGTPAEKEAELTLIRSGHWSIEQPAVIHDDDTELLSTWRTHTVFAVGDAQLCWVDLYRGLLFCSVFDDETPVLRHVPLPPEAAAMESHTGPGSSRNVCVTVTASGGTPAVKFVGIFPRCCCGGAGFTHCQRSRHAYTVRTWTLSTDTMAWAMDAVVDATELWALDAYGAEGLPRVPLSNPIVSLDDPHTVCFLVCEWYHDRDGGDPTEWLVMVDMRRKALVSVSLLSDGGSFKGLQGLLPSWVSCYLDPNPGSSSWAPSLGEGCMDMVVQSSPLVAVVDEPQTNDDAGSSAPSSCKCSSAIMAALQEIPSYGLDRDDMLKAYSILSHDDGRRFRALLGLPKNLRKDWLLMEIKATEA